MTKTWIAIDANLLISNEATTQILLCGSRRMWGIKLFHEWLTNQFINRESQWQENSKSIGGNWVQIVSVLYTIRIAIS